MTFLQEEEVFPNFSVSDALVKEVNETVITSDAPGKEEVNDASEILGTMQNGKRKLLDKEPEKKVFHLKFSSFSLSLSKFNYSIYFFTSPDWNYFETEHVA